MQADHFFTIGQPHVRMGGPCEDYALSAESDDGNFAIAVVSDGCGGAFANTDVGARVVAHTFMQLAGALRGQPGTSWFSPEFRQQLCEAVHTRALSPTREDRFATLVGLVATRVEARALIMGDGGVCVRYANGRLRLIEAEWADNAPCYPAYLHDAEDRRGFLEAISADRQATAFRLNYTDARVTEKSGACEVLAEWNEAFSADAASDGMVLRFNPQDEAIEGIAVLSDGLARIGGISDGTFHQAEMAARFTAFTNFRGGFVKRQMVAEMQALAKAGHLPGDDLAIACAWFANLD